MAQQEEAPHSNVTVASVATPTSTATPIEPDESHDINDDVVTMHTSDVESEGESQSDEEMIELNLAQLTARNTLVTETLDGGGNLLVLERLMEVLHEMRSIESDTDELISEHLQWVDSELQSVSLFNLN
jgi:hypothetical protein